MGRGTAPARPLEGIWADFQGSGQPTKEKQLEQAGAARCLKWILHKDKRIRRLPVQLYHRLRALISIVEYAEFLHRYTALGYG